MHSINFRINVIIDSGFGPEFDGMFVFVGETVAVAAGSVVVDGDGTDGVGAVEGDELLLIEEPSAGDDSLDCCFLSDFPLGAMVSLL